MPGPSEYIADSRGADDESLCNDDTVSDFDTIDHIVSGMFYVLDWHLLNERTIAMAKATRTNHGTAATVGYEAELWRIADALRGSMAPQMEPETYCVYLAEFDSEAESAEATT